MSELVTQRLGAVLIARLNRPEARNALNGTLIDGIGRAMTEAESDPDIRAVVLTASGDRVFCAGMDLRAFGGGESVEAGSAEGTAGFARLLDGTLTVPVIGAANGTAVGGGFELLLGCDVVVAAETARFGFPEVKRALFPAGGGTWLGTRIPLAVALEMMLTGDPIDAARAHHLGLVNAVVPPDQVLEAAVALADRIAANGPLAVAAIKELVRLAVTDPARAAERKQRLQVTVFGSEDAKEGAAAFVEKREPVWKGR
ncbi:enoyl-CoA hydratase [Amycolatopsis sp. K13G38]|uniref:Enoyl-CoA hydratase n=1 Tax=Amycolatopsis acididurans TaxID=2724524 RepID=A0ABX1IVL3_9PSEU|nr:enoyl-CoA hydratase-related protein [Amycolatopsis acididurans]NKQ51525.1 enoyl-CoA hydratase [Amycolatopsis acididurans]